MTTPSDDPDAPDVGVRLLGDLDRLSGVPCCCGARLCGHAVLCSVALGFKAMPRCLACLARGLDRPEADLREDLAGYMQRRDCYRRAWDAASEREGLPRTARPSCLWPGDAPAPQGGPARDSAEVVGELPASAAWDGGDMACGDLVMALRGRLNGLAPGAILRVTARDPAAPEDLPAWCRLTGHRLLRAAHPDYFIQRKEV